MYPINKREIPACGKYTNELLERFAARDLYFFKVLAARKKNLSTARACKNKYTARMLENARKDHSIPLIVWYYLGNKSLFTYVNCIYKNKVLQKTKCENYSLRHRLG
ncbi:hypothetical protein AWC38_SpisGene25888 [Stylophora pistillata]|uniref:Uncharacterized protein n=1 Tax=Stylophora pistillata TaxID=50429 RepID=A0A2B4SP31_STYPI|nr:hypothetical protein AWC38_SpisGene25888 [Stylophora pistillata]